MSSQGWISVGICYPQKRTADDKGYLVQVWDGERVRVEWYDFILANSGGAYIPYKGFESEYDILMWSPLLDAPL